MPIPFEKLTADWMREPSFRVALERVRPRMDLAFDLAEARHRAGLTQAQLAERMGTTLAWISRWESGQAVPTPTSRRRYLQAAGSVSDDEQASGV